MNKTAKLHNATDDYFELVRRLPLRAIRTKADYAAAVAVLGELAPRGDSLSVGEGDYFDALSQLIGVYEEQHYPRENPFATPLEFLKYLMAESGMNTLELGELLGSGRGQASMILNGKRELSKANIRVLADHFKINAGAFL